MEELNIYQKLAKIRKPVEIIRKNKKGFGYTYADEEEILSRITGLMGKYGVSLIPNICHDSLKVEPYHYLKTKTMKNGTPYEEHVNEIIVTADMEWIWVNDENPTERVVVPWVLVASQSDASQALGASLTYSSRYFLLKYFNSATSDSDPDNYRTRQKEAELEEDRLIAEGIIEQVHTIVSEYVKANPDNKQKVAAIVKKYAKKDGKPSSDYFRIKESAVASQLLSELNETLK